MGIVVVGEGQDGGWIKVVVMRGGTGQDGGCD